MLLPECSLLPVPALWGLPVGLGSKLVAFTLSGQARSNCSEDMIVCQDCIAGWWGPWRLGSVYVVGAIWAEFSVYDRDHVGFGVTVCDGLCGVGSGWGPCELGLVYVMGIIWCLGSVYVTETI